jgi:hypothetical protein
MKNKEKIQQLKRENTKPSLSQNQILNLEVEGWIDMNIKLGRKYKELKSLNEGLTELAAKNHQEIKSLKGVNAYNILITSTLNDRISEIPAIKKDRFYIGFLVGCGTALLIWLLTLL